MCTSYREGPLIVERIVCAAEMHFKSSGTIFYKDFMLISYAYDIDMISWNWFHCCIFCIDIRLRLYQNFYSLDPTSTSALKSTGNSIENNLGHYQKSLTASSPWNVGMTIVIWHIGPIVATQKVWILKSFEQFCFL